MPWNPFWLINQLYFTEYIQIHVYNGTTLDMVFGVD